MTLSADQRDRILPLQGAGNFRDFGGYETRAGDRVVRGRLFRSNRLSQLVADDIATLEDARIATIFDLRAPRERDADPTVWTGDHLTTHVFAPGHKRRLVDMALDYPPGETGALALMHDFYAELPRTLGHAFGEIVRRIADGEVPCVIHCSAGKDRTGMAAALVLAALDVPRETIRADYAMTDLLAASEEDMARSVVTAGSETKPAREEMRRRFPPEAIAIMRAARPSYIEAAFSALEREHGSLEAYLDAIGVDRAVRRRLKDRLTEPG